MPVHDWTRVSAGNFHHFHQNWISKLADYFNTGGLPDGYEAHAEPVSGSYIPDVVTLRTAPTTTGGPAVLVAPPTTREAVLIDRSNYLRRKNRLAIRHPSGEVVAVIELVSPGNKDSRRAIRTFVEKATEFIDQGVNLLVVDLFPPTARDPQGVHRLILDQFDESQSFGFDPGKPLTVASYVGGPPIRAYVDTVGVGDPLPSAPLYLDDQAYVLCPLEATYQQVWAVLPRSIKADLDRA